jgi:hypothetical protein
MKRSAMTENLAMNPQNPAASLRGVPAGRVGVRRSGKRRSASEVRRMKFFYGGLLLTTLLPFLSFVVPLFPAQVFGLNMTGWAWTLMLCMALLHIPAVARIRFPLGYWLPWTIYAIGYILYDYSFLGLQLTCQYLLPVLIGVIASSFIYSDNLLLWIFRWFLRLCLFVFGIFAVYQAVWGYNPAMAATPMLLSIPAALISARYYVQPRQKYLLAYGLFFLVPFISMTRMGITVFIAIFVLHFANRRIKTKIWGGLIAALLVVIVFNSSGFQEKTFYSGYGDLGDIQINYYEAERLNTSGRTTWKRVLEPGIEASPIWGNGPRADNEALRVILGLRAGEAHNDYLSVVYNYGYFGLILLLGAFFATGFRLWRMSRKEKNRLRYLIVTSSATLFIGFMMFMYTDNILKYTIFFPNWFFVMIGIAFAPHRNETVSKRCVKRV